MDYFSTRATVRNYTDIEIPDNLLQSIVARAVKAPTTGGMQLYSVIVTRDPEKRKTLAEAHFNQPAAAGCQAILTVCADFNRFSRWCRISNADPGYDNMLSFQNAATDALLFCQTFCNLAEEEGLGCCFLGTTVYMPQMIIDVLQLPELVVPVATITLGWPDEQPALTDRLPLDAIMHEETYTDYTPERIDRFYAEKEALEENREFVRLNGKQTLAQVYTDCRYTRKDNEAMSAGLLEVLKKQGFLRR